MGLFKGDFAEEFRTVEVGLRCVDREKADVVRLRTQIGALVQVAFQVDRFAFVFDSDKIQRYCHYEIPGEQAFEFLKRACAA